MADRNVVPISRSKTGKGVNFPILSGFANLLRDYFKAEVEGAHHIPKRGPAIILPNHSGFAGADAIMLAHLIRRATGRSPKFLAHRGYFHWFDAIRTVAESYGLREASLRNGVQLLRQNELVIVFPEGEEGNFKASSNRYRLQPFRRGFLRMAVQARVPIIPCLIIGAEETHLNLGSIDLTRFVKGLKIPLPLNLFPLPAKWKIRFLEPIDMKRASPRLLDRKEEVHHLVEGTRIRMQRELNRELQRRPYIYHGPRWLTRALERGVKMIG